VIESDLARVIDDFCGTPPRWPLPWPPRYVFKRERLSAVQLLATAARFHAAAGAMGRRPEALSFEAAAEKLADAGLERLG
jgi:hypothetical protein